MRITASFLAVAAALLDDPGGRHWGYDLSKRAAVRSGVMYPMLARMLQAGWLLDGWEDVSEQGTRRPPRRYYTLTEAGLGELGAILASAEATRQATSPAQREGASWA